MPLLCYVWREHEWTHRNPHVGDCWVCLYHGMHRIPNRLCGIIGTDHHADAVNY